jgi:hypothetical protein
MKLLLQRNSVIYTIRMEASDKDTLETYRRYLNNSNKLFHVKSLSSLKPRANLRSRRCGVIAEGRHAL